MLPLPAVENLPHLPKTDNRFDIAGLQPLWDVKSTQAPASQI
jgi:hypothetical protein